MLTDTVIVAHFSSSALAALALGAPVYLTALMTLRGWPTSAQIMTARRIGRSDKEGAAASTLAAIALAATTGSLFCGCIVAAARPLAALATTDQQLQEDCVSYLQVVALAVPLAAVLSTAQAAYAGYRRTGVGLIATLLVATCNAAAGIVLVLSFKLGVLGAGISTVASTSVGVAFLAIRAHRLVQDLVRNPRLILSAIRENYRPLSMVAIPEGTLYFFGYITEIVLALIVARRGIIELGAYRMLDALTTTLQTTAAAVASGVTIIAGQQLGHVGAIKQSVSRAGAILSLLLMMPIVIPLSIAPEFFYGLASGDRSIVEIASQSTAVAAASILPLAVALNIAGVLRAARRNSTVMSISLLGDYLFLVPVAWVLGWSFDLGVTGVFIGWCCYGITMLVGCYIAAKRRPELVSMPA